MAKKERKKSFFKRSIKVANDNFKGIFKEIVENAKSNSDVDLKILEPDLNKAIKEVAEELKKDKKNAKFKVEELKGIISNAFSSVKEAIRTDENNNLEDSVKKEWYDELDDFDLEGFIDNIDFDEDELDDEDEGSFEDINDDDNPSIENMLSKENIKRVLDAIILILCSSEDECFKRFMENNMENISSIISFKTCKGKEVPIDIKPEDSTDIDLGITRSMELVYQFISLEDDIDVKDSEYVDRTVEENLENIGEPEFEVIKEDKELLTEEVLDKYKKIIEEGRLVEERLLSIRERMSDEEKNMVDYAISCLIEIFDMFKKSEEYQAHKNNHSNTDIDFVEFILTYTKPLDIELLKDTLNCSNIFKIELILVTLMNIPVL